MDAAFFDQTSIATPAAIIGRLNHYPMLTVKPRPKMPACGSRKNSAMKRAVQ
jgi:hypothetical protein